MKLLVIISLIGLAIAGKDDLDVNQEFLDGYNKFTSNVYKQLSKSTPNNFIVSPISVDVLLALVELGSVGQTSKELIKGLSLPENKEKIREAFTSLTPKLNVNDKYTLKSANKIYVKKDLHLLAEFQKLAVDIYNAEVENIDFNKKELAAQTMNKWVEEKTEHKIKNLVKKEELNDDTRTVLINALFFHGNWVTKFNTADTKKDTFHLDNTRQSQVDLMEIKHNYKYYEDRELNAKFLELPYNGDDVTLTIVLPNENDGLKDLEENILQVLDKPRYKVEQVHARIPKFKIETEVQFNSILKNLGIINSFEDYAEFPKITGEPLKISKVVQKAVIEIEEEGTTAAAATVVYVQLIRSGHVLQETKQFIADHPFIFVLKYKSIVLFIGHYTGQ